MKNMVTKFKRLGASVLTAVLLMPVSTVWADPIGAGTKEEALQLAAPVLQQIGPIFSMFINLCFLAFGVISTVKAVFQGYKYFTVDDPREKDTIKKALISSIVAIAIAVVGGLLVNVVLNMFGLGGIFQVA